MRLGLFLMAALAAGSAGAQESTRSTLADVAFPQPGQVWLRDAEGSQVATLELAASLAGRSCGSSEFHIWRALDIPPNDLRAGVDAAFETAGWRLGLISLSDNGERIALANRNGAELVMSWLPTQGGIGLLLCNVVGTQAAEALPEPDLPEPPPVPADFIPIPIPRPAPGEPAVAAAPVIELPAGEEAPDAEAADDGIAALIEDEPRVPSADDEAAPDVTPEIVLEPEPDLPEEAPPAAEAAAVDTEEPAAGGQSFFSILVLLVIAGAAGAGAYFLGRRGWAELHRGRVVPSWPGAVATVLYSQVASQTRTDAKGLARTVFVPVIEYEYEVGGELYQAARLSFDDAAETSAAAAERIVAQYPVGAGIEIRYDPKDPFNATIDGGGERLNLSLIAAIGLGVLALASLIAAIS
ncbi:MAG: DUF3592 domain-containing protein [Bauldia sp.]|nr:DUF3592 domain-containing protein [Bauldia sp.]